MKHDILPSIILGGIISDEKAQLFTQEAIKRGMKPRELRFFEVTINTHPDFYDGQINWLKSFMQNQIHSMFERVFSMPFGGTIKRKLEESTGFTFPKLKWDWERHQKHPLVNTKLSPLLIDGRRIGHPNLEKYAEHPQEIENYKRILTLESDGYKSDIEETIEEIKNSVDEKAKEVLNND